MPFGCENKLPPVRARWRCGCYRQKNKSGSLSNKNYLMFSNINKEGRLSAMKEKEGDTGFCSVSLLLLQASRFWPRTCLNHVAKQTVQVTTST